MDRQLQHEMMSISIEFNLFLEICFRMNGLGSWGLDLTHLKIVDVMNVG
jgi:hypothetical protein